MFILLIDIDDDTRSVVFNDLSLHDISKKLMIGSTGPFYDKPWRLWDSKINGLIK
jgi:hypothetical protein